MNSITKQPARCLLQCFFIINRGGNPARFDQENLYKCWTWSKNIQISNFPLNVDFESLNTGLVHFCWNMQQTYEYTTVAFKQHKMQTYQPDETMQQYLDEISYNLDAVFYEVFTGKKCLVVWPCPPIKQQTWHCK